MARTRTYGKYSNKKAISTSKIVLMCMIIMCIEIVIFVEYATVKLNDTSALYSLIGIPVALTPTIVSYFIKSKAENTAGGIVYETAIKDMEINGAAG